MGSSYVEIQFMIKGVFQTSGKKGLYNKYIETTG